jgi:AcrR family transcriptional regulator
MARKTFEEAQQTRRRIIQIAIQHCKQRGYEGLSLVEVAQEAQVTRGAIYHHFPSKQALFLEMVEQLLGSMGSAILESAEKAPDTWQSLLAGCRTFLKVSQNEAYQTIILGQAPAILGTVHWNRLDREYTTDCAVFGSHGPDGRKGDCRSGCPCRRRSPFGRHEPTQPLDCRREQP